MIVIQKDQEFSLDGKLICVAKRDLYAGEPASPTDFYWIGVDHPQIGDPIHPAILLAFKRGREKGNR
jgi:hypothetical protein